MQEYAPRLQRDAYPEKRRAFLHFFFGGLTVLWTGGMLWALKNFFFFKPRPSMFTIGMFSNYRTGAIVHHETLRLFIARDGKGLYAMSDRCTHRGCTLRIDTNQLRCPCHDARFDLYGTPVNGPADRRLDYYFIYKNNDKTLTVDPGRTVGSSFRYVEAS